MAQSYPYLGDTSLPCLAQALDAETIRRICQDFLVDDQETEITACNILRLRYRRGQRAIIQYQLTLRRADGSEQPLWLAGYQYADAKRYRSETRRLRRLVSDHRPENGLPPGIAIPALELLLLRFPYDRRLPALVPLFFNIEQMVSNRLALLLGDNGWRLESLQARPVRWRVGLSAVLRLELAARHETSGEKRCSELFLKHDASRCGPGGRSKLEALEHLRKLPFGLCPTLLSIPHPGLTIQAAAAGQSLEQRLSQGTASRADAVMLGKLLSRWHMSGELLQEPYAREKFERVLDRSVRLLTVATPHNGRRLQKLATGIRRQMLHRVSCPAHLDLKPEHVFYDGGRITLIDVESAADADPMLDLAILYARLMHGRKLYGLPEKRARGFAAELMRAYSQQVPPSWWYNFPACYAWALLKVGVHLFACQRPGWPALTDRFVHEAETALERTNGRLTFLPRRENCAVEAYPSVATSAQPLGNESFA